MSLRYHFFLGAALTPFLFVILWILFTKRNFLFLVVKKAVGILIQALILTAIKIFRGRPEHPKKLEPIFSFSASVDPAKLRPRKKENLKARFLDHRQEKERVKLFSTSDSSDVEKGQKKREKIGRISKFSKWASIGLLAVGNPGATAFIMENSKTQNGMLTLSFNSILFSAGIISFFPHLASTIQCDEVDFINVPIDSCDENEGKLDCRTNQLSVVSMKIDQSSHCFNVLFDKQPKNQYRVTTKGLKMRCQKKTLYHTFEPSISCLSKKVCSDSNLCYGSNCASFRTSNLSKIIWPSKEEELVEKECSTSCGCWGCGCFYCTDACLFKQAVLSNPSKKTYEVFQCSKWSLVAKLEIASTAENSSKEIEIEVGSKRTVGDIEISIFSFSLPMLELESACFLKEGNTYSKVFCQTQDTLQTGKIGEIRCDQRSSALFPSPNNCQFAKGLVTFNDLRDSSECSSSSVPLARIHKDKLLPMRSSHGILNVSSDGFVENVVDSTSLISLSLKLKHASFQHVSLTSDKCLFSFKKLKGCYSCEEGSDLTISAKTDKFDQASYIFCEQDRASSFFVARPIQREVKIPLHFQRSKIDTKCEIFCANKKSMISIFGTLDYKPGYKEYFKIKSKTSSATFERQNYFNILRDFLSSLESMVPSAWTYIRVTAVVAFCLILLKLMCPILRVFRFFFHRRA
uniref:Putative glycoprotein n=1 Tax=Bombus-associated virus Phle1 TaxID=2511060 RepID=A0A411D386_9VIRU|nr:putative glycoprotein precursor [Bombus-associated virus Phle1]